MKKLSFLFFLIVFILSSSGCSRSENFKNINFSEVVIIEGVYQEELFSRISMWVRFTFRRSLSYILHGNADEGIIKLRYVYRTLIERNTTDIISIITLEVRDEEYTITFSDASFQVYDDEGLPYGEETSLPSQDIADMLIFQWKSLADDLKQVVLRFPSE
ncbi:MAG: DUF4468 domain-containing protein [Treponema sp.]|nr:DUF4468 domain-containing protein [Treponema sp.]